MTGDPQHGAPRRFTFHQLSEGHLGGLVGRCLDHPEFVIESTIWIESIRGNEVRMMSEIAHHLATCKKMIVVPGQQLLGLHNHHGGSHCPNAGRGIGGGRLGR